MSIASPHRIGIYTRMPRDKSLNLHRYYYLTDTTAIRFTLNMLFINMMLRVQASWDYNGSLAVWLSVSIHGCLQNRQIRAYMLKVAWSEWKCIMKDKGLIWRSGEDEKWLKLETACQWLTERSTSKSSRAWADWPLILYWIESPTQYKREKCSGHKRVIVGIIPTVLSSPLDWRRNY